MNEFYNFNTFVNNLNTETEIENDLWSLIEFTTNIKFSRDIISRIPFTNNISKNPIDTDEYYFNYSGRKIPFSVFSDFELQKYDKELLESKKRIDVGLCRTLKLACSMDLLNPRISIGNSATLIPDLLIIFEKNGVDKVISYFNNLVMNKDDYYQIFKYDEINVVDKFDLYKIYYLIDKTDDYKHIYEYLIFTKMMFDDLAKKQYFKFLTEKYDVDGINLNNYIFFGNKCDLLFFQKCDLNKRKYDSVIREINKFTENPDIKAKHISFDEKSNKYKFRDIKYGSFTFSLLSDVIVSKEIKDTLLSDKRYHKCHYNSIVIARSLKEEDKKSAYVVGGKFRENEIDYFLHSWVEIDNRNIVIDFNHNIVMNRDKYYKFFDVKPISKNHILELEDAIETIINDAELILSPLKLNYFGTEIMRDLKKSEKIFKKTYK